MFNNESILLTNTPRDWNTKKIKYVFDERKEVNDPVKTDTLVSLTHDRGVILHSDKGDIGNKEKNDLTKYKLVYPGDIVINSMNVIIGSSGLSRYYGLVSPVYYMLVKKCDDYDEKLFHYLFRSVVFQKSLIGVGNGILEHRMRIPMDKLGSQFIPIPPPKEQKLISCYLDKKTEQIGKLIEKIQKKIELLKEQRTALINRCVTKGLDPNVEMRDSGIERIGEIPKHWKIIRLKYLAKNGVQYGLNIEPESYVENGTRFLRITDIRSDGTLKEEDGVYLESSDIPQEYLLNRGDLLFSRSGGTVGKSTLIDALNYPMSFAGYLIRVSFANYSLATFIKWVTESGMYWRWIDLQAIQSTIQNVNGEKYSNFAFSLPSLDEIEGINRHLSDTTRLIDQVLDLHQQKIMKLIEYRKSLISSVVTGKGRVTEDMI